MGKILFVAALLGVFVASSIAGQCKLDDKQKKNMIKKLNNCLKKGYVAVKLSSCEAKGEPKLSGKQSKKCKKYENKLAACEYDCPVNGGWSEWSQFGNCSVECGGGILTRSRACNNPAPANGGAECVGDSELVQPCNDVPCPVDGGWSQYGNWSACSAECGSGNQTRSRACNNPEPAFGGKNCEGSAVEGRSCNENPCPVDGGWSEFSDWSDCSAECGGGEQSRKRACNNPAPANGGANCEGDDSETRACNEDACPPRLPSWPEDFKWSNNGVPDGYTCTRVLEFDQPADQGWDNNFFCWKNGFADPGIRFASEGAVPSVKCVAITETADSGGWDNNFLCVPNNSPYNFKWDSAKRIDGLECIQWDEPADPDTWADNFLCNEKLEGPAVTAPLPKWAEDWKWSYAGAPDGYTCERIIERAEPAETTWTDNYFCWRNDMNDPGLRWSMAGPIAGQKCTQILETADPHTWNDNYICLPLDSPYNFSWNSAGPIEGKQCIQWLEPADDAGTWSDNYLCM